MFKYIFLGIFLICSVGYAADGVKAKRQELHRCLCKCWGIDPHTAVFIERKVKVLLDDTVQHAILDNFIEKSKKLNINFSAEKKLTPLPAEDGVLRSPKQHLVIFESPYVRVLWGSTLPGEVEPLHIHAWPSLIVIIKPTVYKIDYANGTSEIGNWPIGVYDLPIEHYSCTNIGPEADECLRFEIK